MKIFFTLLFAGLYLISFGQITEFDSKGEEVTYYKYLDQNKTVSKRKGNFKRIVSTVEDGVTKIEYFQISSNILRKEQFLDNGKPVGVWRDFDTEGNLSKKRDLDSIKYCVKEKSAKTDSTKTVDKEAVFVGGEPEMYSFLSQNITYPTFAKYNFITGKVYIQFIIEKNGDVTPKCIHKINNNSNKLLEYEAIRVISIMPKWEPGEKDGKAVRTLFNLPISFKLN